RDVGGSRSERDPVAEHARRPRCRRRGLRPARHHRHPRLRRPALRADPVQARHRGRGRGVRRRVGPAAQPVAVQGVRPLHEPPVTFTLYVDEDRWRAHQRTVLDASPGLVPVVKGTGYGFGNARLAAEAARLGVDTVAVGTVNEVDEVRSPYAGDVLVLTPTYDTPDMTQPDGTIQTVAHLERLRSLAGTPARVVLECLTSMHRHGLTEADA